MGQRSGGDVKWRGGCATEHSPGGMEGVRAREHTQAYAYAIKSYRAETGLHVGLKVGFDL